MSRRCCISPKTMFEMLEISPLLGQGVEECRDKHSRCFQGRMSSRHSRLAGHLWTITKSQTRRNPACALGSLPCFLSQPQATGRNIPGHSGATVSPDPRLPPSASLSDFWLELGGGTVANGTVPAESRGKGKLGSLWRGPPMGCPEPAETLAQCQAQCWVLGRNSYMGPGCRQWSTPWKAEQTRWRAACPAEPSARTGMF